jgi:ribosomal protein S18 acetylase RimI-like enzyme
MLTSHAREQKMNLTIARLGPLDVARAQTNCALFSNMKDASANLATYLADPLCILLVAEVDGEPVGQIVGHVLKRWDSKSPMLFLYSVDVVESHRRKGIARGMIQEFLRIGREAGCGSSFVFTNESNGPAMEMYQSLGGIRTNPDDVMFEWEMNHEQRDTAATLKSVRSAVSEGPDA